MHNDNTIEQDEKIIAKIDSSIISRISEALMFTLNIPDGSNLVAILGTGNETNNFDSIKTWVMDQKLDFDNINAIQTLSFLEDKLILKLIEHQSMSDIYS